MVAFALLCALAHALVGSDYVLVSPNGIDAQTFDGLNAAHGADKLSLYNSSWGATINPNQFNILVRVNDDRVTFVRPYNTTGAVSIPADTWVIAASDTKLPVLSGYDVEDVLWVRPTDVCPSTNGVPVIVFHDLGATSTNFETTLDALDALDYTTITLEELSDCLNGVGSLPANPIVLTFDDGYDSHFAFGAQLLHEHGMVGTFFIITNRPGTTATWATWAEINAGLATYPDAVELACHSHAAHSNPGGVGLYMTMSDVERAADLTTCHDTLLAQTGVDTYAVAWPFGQYDEALVDTAESVGYSLIFTTKLGLNHQRNSDADGHVRRFGANVADAWSDTETAIDRWHLCL